MSDFDYGSESDIINLWRKLSEDEKLNGKVPSKQDVIDFLRANPNPSDSKFHRWAESNGFNVSGAETVAYALASDHVKILEK